MLDAISDLARDQHGVVHLDDIRPLGATTSWCSRQTARGLLERRAPAVYALAGAPRTRRQELLVHVRAAGPGALSTADSALGLWCPELELPPKPEVVVPMHCGYRSPGVRLWRSADLHLAKPTVRDGIPTVGVVRACSMHPAGARRTRSRG